MFVSCPPGFRSPTCSASAMPTASSCSLMQQALRASRVSDFNEGDLKEALGSQNTDPDGGARVKAG